VYPDFFTRNGGLHHSAAIDIAVVEKFFLSFEPQFKSVCSSAEALTERANESAFLIKDNDRLAAHA
jgi:hypothetical protein